MTDKIEEKGHKRGCEGRNYACTCGYDDRVEAEFSRLRSSNEAMRKALEPFADIANLIEAETEGLTEDDTCDLMFHDYLMERFAVHEFFEARAALSLQEEEAR